MKRFLVGGLMSWAALSSVLAERPNILLLLVDDLKPAMGCYGDAAAKTPAMDRLAARGMRFDLAYCNQAVCAPSRFTLMLGAHSTSTGLYGLGSQLRQVLPDAVTLPQHFAKLGGYRTESIGKVFHIGHGNEGDPESFSVPHFKDLVIEYRDPASTAGGQLTREEALFTNQKLDQIRSLPRGAAFEAPEVADEAYADGRVAAETVRRLEAAKARREKEGTPFFIAAGFVRPHLPFSAPKKYWDLHDPATLPMPEFEEHPAGSPKVAQKRGGEIAAYDPVPEDRDAVYSEALKRRLIHGYYASTSYVDAQIGKVIEALDRLGLADNTVIVLWGDHGFHLGDLGVWTKHTNYEQANRIPLIIVAPGVATPGSATRQLASSVDVFPTLTELADLPPQWGPQPVDGVSLVPVLRDPAVRVRDHAYHAYPNAKIGRAIRTERYRLVEWRNPSEPPSSAEWELYDYVEDPLETRNLANEKAELMAELKAILARYPDAVPRAPTSATGKRKDNAARPRQTHR
jgi:iduronate 2-sulfatase